MNPWIAAIPALVGFGLLVGVAARELQDDWRQRRWQRRADRDDTRGRHALEVELPPGGGQPTLQAWWEMHDQGKPRTVNAHGQTIRVAPSKEIRIAVTWPDEPPTDDLRQRLASVDPRLRGLVDYLVHPDNSFAPNDRGFCHVAWDLPYERIEAIANNFVDLAWLLTSEPDEAIAALLVRAERGAVPAGGVGFRALFRHAGAFEPVKQAARRQVAHEDSAVAFAALGLAGGPLDDLLNLAHRNDHPPARAEAMARLAIGWGALDEPHTAFSLLASTAAWGPAFEHFDGEPPEPIRDWLLAVLDGIDARNFVVPSVLASAKALGSWTDEGSELLLLRWYDSHVPDLAQAAAESLSQREVPLAATRALAKVHLAEGPLSRRRHLEVLCACGQLDHVEGLLEARTNLPRTLHADVDRAIARIQDRGGGGQAGGLSVVAPGGQLSLAGGGELAMEEAPRQEPAPRRPARSKT